VRPEIDASTAGIASRAAYVLVVLSVLAGGVILHSAALHGGYLTDDYLMQAMLDGRYPVERSTLDLYAFVGDARGEVEKLVDGGILPWWSDPELRLRALRPLSSALIWLEHSVLGLSAFARHLHSLAWWMALIVIYAAFVRRALPPAVAMLATLHFALDAAHSVPLAWIANRTTLISAFFGVMALLGHFEWREHQRRWGIWVSALGALSSLAAGEYGVCAIAYLVAYELCAVRGSFRERARVLVPILLLLGAYAAFYRTSYGAVASTMYVDPLAAPHDFLVNALGRFPAALVNEVLNVPGEMTLSAMVLGEWGVLLLLLPLAAVGALVWDALRRAPEQVRRVLLALLVGSLLSLLPLVGTIPSTRILLLPSIGGSALLATLFWDAAQRLVARGERRRVLTWVRVAVCAVLVPFHFVLAPYVSYAGARAFRRDQELSRSTVVRGEIERAAERDFVLLSARDPTFLMYVPFILHDAGRGVPRSWRALTMTSRPISVRRVLSNTLELSVNGGSLLENPVVYLFRRGDHPLREGQVVRLRGLEVTVLKVEGRGPSSLRVRFDRSLDDPSLVLLTISPNGLRRMAVPAVGREAVFGS
jgi:hypothetical protein